MKHQGYRTHRGTGGGARTRHGSARLSLLLVALLLAPFAGASRGTANPAANPPDDGTGPSWTGYENQPLRVNITQGLGDRDTYRRGEQINIAFEANQDAYAVVYRIDSDGGVTILWPRSRLDDGFVFGRHQYSLPAAGAPRLRAGSEPGVEYVEAVVSLYPFDLRDIEVDFHHEPADEDYRYAVAGDPFLAMNEVNHAITRLENAEDFVVTNYVSYYVERQVEHPRYLCGQCHADENYDPYGASCTIAIHHDYDWSNRWYVRFGYYPVYQYPAYYYVDPWSSRPWINYWYTPWYDWPGYAVYDWPFSCYVWNYSPYWHADAWSRWKSGDRRYTPLDKRDIRDERWRQKQIARSTPFVREARPPRDVEEVLRTRTKLDRDGVRVQQGGGGRGDFANVAPDLRQPVTFRETPGRDAREGGLRVREDRGRGGRVPPAVGGRTREGQPRDGGVRTPVRSGDQRFSPARGGSGGTERERDGSDRGAIRPLDPRKPVARIWSGGRGGSTAERGERTAPESRRGRDAEPARVRDGSGETRAPESARGQAVRGDDRPSSTDRPAPSLRREDRPASPPSARAGGGSSTARPAGGGGRTKAGQAGNGEQRRR